MEVERLAQRHTTNTWPNWDFSSPASQNPSNEPCKRLIRKKPLISGLPHLSYDLIHQCGPADPLGVPASPCPP